MTQLQFNATVCDGKYTVFKEVGHGANGTVYLGCVTSTGKKVAIKQIPTYKLTELEIETLTNEIHLHSIMSDHENVVQLLDSFKTKQEIYIVMEYCKQGDMFDYIVSLTTQDRIDKVNYHKKLALDLVRTVMDCHFNFIYHRDLKPENLLLHGTSLKLADFGLATQDVLSNHVGCGSTNYMAPEALNQNFNLNYISSDDEDDDEYIDFSYCTVKSDIWSIGIILINLFCGLNPWSKAELEDNAFLNYYNDPTYLYKHLNITDNFYNLLKMCLNPDPNCRSDLNQIYIALLDCNQFLTTEPEVVPVKEDLSESLDQFDASHLVMDEASFSDSNSDTSSNITLSSDTIGTGYNDFKFLETNNLFKLYFENYNLNIDPTDLC